MRLYTVCIFVLVVVAVQGAKNSEKEKRRAQNYGSGNTAYTAVPSSTYATATTSPVYATAATAAPAYASKGSPKANYISQPVSYEQQQITVQQPKYVYQSQNTRTAPQQQFSYSFEAQPELKLALAQAQAQAQGIKYNLQPQAQVKYVTQPEVKYAFAQPQQEVKYAFAQPQQELKYAFAQPAAVAGKYISAPAPAPAKVAYPTQTVYQQVQQVQQVQPAHQVQPHYSPASSVSSFSFSNPHVSYSNLGLLSQVVGKGYSAPQAQQQQVQYVSQPAAAPVPHYITASQGAQPVQYVASPQAQHSTQQLVYVPQGYAQKSGVTYA